MRIERIEFITDGAKVVLENGKVVNLMGLSAHTLRNDCEKFLKEEFKSAGKELT